MMLGSRIYFIALLIAISIVSCSSMWFSKELDQYLYAREAFIPPSTIEVGPKELKLPDDLILMTWPAEFPRYQYYDIRMRSQLSRSRLRFGIGLMNDLVRQQQRCAGETVYAFLMSCDGMSEESDRLVRKDIDATFWHVFGVSGSTDVTPWYSAAVVFSDRNVLWFEGNQADCSKLAGAVAKAFDIPLDWFCQSL